jgi:uncharacterized protein
MSADRYPQGAPCWIATTPEGLDFAAALLGWEVADGIATLGGRPVAGVSDDVPGWVTYMRDGEDGLHTDPSGALFGTSREGTCEAVNVPGGWNWSILHTPDVAGASRFYGERFGWEIDPNGLIRLPGYVDVLELHDPGIRQRHADVGTPPGFSDAVAWVAEDEGPARWELTFAVADADAAAMRAPELGAEVLQEPHDVPPVRRAEIRDPTGTVLTVNSYSP